ncbi:LPS translocon maturation chaperone LptM [Kordiimonas sp.]
MKQLIKSVVIMSVLLCTGASLSACGKKGDVKPPPSYQNSND